MILQKIWEHRAGIISWFNEKKEWLVAVVFALYEVLKAFAVIVVTDSQDSAVTKLILVVFGLAVTSGVKKMTGIMRGMAGQK